MPLNFFLKCQEQLRSLYELPATHRSLKKCWFECIKFIAFCTCQGRLRREEGRNYLLWSVGNEIFLHHLRGQISSQFRAIIRKVFAHKKFFFRDITKRTSWIFFSIFKLELPFFDAYLLIGPNSPFQEILSGRNTFVFIVIIEDHA